MFGVLIFIVSVVVGIYLLSKKIKTEKGEDFEDRNN
tara:strand:+ start:1086 stop:1193 length:108 start_codon:yes stop_codon:yes gene_type:complete